MDFLNNVASYAGLVTIIGAVVAYIFSKLYRTKFEKRKDWQKQFNEVVLQLSVSNETSQLAAAVMLRRFFSAQIDQNKFRDEAVRVIASLLKILPSGIYQKTLGDGLAFAENLNYADLQRSNLQDLYLGVKNKADDEQEKAKAQQKYEEERCDNKNNFKENKEDDSKQKSEQRTKKKKNVLCSPEEKWKITMDFTDLFEANLSLALMENIKGFGTVFYGAIMNHTKIKNCEFINADFRGVDLMNAVFENVKLTGSNFSGAKHLPPGLQEHLDNKNIYHESPETEENGFSSKKTNRDGKCVFFSMPGSLTEFDKALSGHYRDLINRMGYKPVIYKRDHYPKSGQLSKVRRDIINSVGLIAFGLKQIHIKKGIARPNLELETDMSGQWLPTPWNDIEVGMAIMKELPVLLVKDENIDIGVFDQKINENRIKCISSSIDVQNIKDNESFKEWVEMLKDQ